MYFIPQGGEVFKGEILENMAGFLRNQSKRQPYISNLSGWKRVNTTWKFLTARFPLKIGKIPKKERIVFQALNFSLNFC